MGWWEEKVSKIEYIHFLPTYDLITFSFRSDFFERTILCNSLVWSCAITGKPGLTYQEAVESEAKARQNLQNFPEPLVVPILYLTSLSYCSRLHELCDDLYMYTQDRYFAGEIVEVTSLNGLRY